MDASWGNKVDLLNLEGVKISLEEQIKSLDVFMDLALLMDKQAVAKSCPLT